MRSTPREILDALRKDEEDLLRLRRDIRSLRAGRRVEHLRLPEALEEERGLKRAIENKRWMLGLEGLGKAWSPKDERQYEAIKKSCLARQRSLGTCKRIAAATVNKRRRLEGRTLGAFLPGVPRLGHEASLRRREKLRRLGCDVTVAVVPEGEVVLRKCPPGIDPADLGQWTFKGRARPGTATAGGWGGSQWVRPCGRNFSTRKDAEAWVAKYGREPGEVEYKIVKGTNPPCPRTFPWGLVGLATVAAIAFGRAD